MTELFFYHLETRPLESVLPALLEKTIARGWRAVVEVGNGERLDALDAVLWTYSDDSFLPHGMERGNPADAEQPILLTSDTTNANGAHVRFYVDRARPRQEEGYERLVYIFNGHDPDAVTEARQIWRDLREVFDLTYWQQDGDGRWSKKG